MKFEKKTPPESTHIRTTPDVLKMLKTIKTKIRDEQEAIVSYSDIIEYLLKDYINKDLSI